MYWRRLNELDLADAADYGGKAAHLGHAAQLGCPVLPGLALSTRLFQRFVEQGGLLGEVSSILDTMQPRTMPQFQAAAWAIGAAFRVRRMPQDVHDALLAAWKELGAVAASVRSSATNEDSPTRSFVGQHASTLDVRSEEQFLAAVLASWTSLFSAKALAYAQHFGVDLLTSSMGLILQPMIAPDIQGTLATLDPITGDPDRFILEVHRGPERGVFDLDPYTRRPGESSYWGQLRYYGLLLDERDLAYQAIEWAIHDGQLSLLRVRPVTAVPPYLPAQAIPQTLTETVWLVSREGVSLRALAPFSRYHLSRIGLAAGEAPLSTATEQAAEASAQTQVCGYLYRGRARDDERNMLDTGALGLMAQSLRRASMGAEVAAEAALLLETDGAWLAQSRVEPADRLSRLDLALLLQRVQHRYDALLAQCRRVAEVLEDVFAALERIYREWAETELPSGTLLSGWRASIGWSAFMAELECDDLLGEPAVSEGPGAEKPASGRAEAVAVEPDILARLNRLQRPVYGALAERRRQLQRLVGDLISAVRLARDVERDAALEAGRRLQAASLAAESHDVALLEADELDRWLRGSVHDDQPLRWIMRRRNERRRAWRYCPPRELPTRAANANADLAECDLVLKGLAVSAGVVVGRARVVHSLAEAAWVLPGEVLVCPEATHELSPLFGTVAAVVAERGALLDHSSVLVREYALPAVFAVATACEQIATGDEVTVDATRGLVGTRRAGSRYLRFELNEL
ncbi:MAG: PEP/pyruvate-binding domain-containing protein [Anaerolineales bacterium]